MNRMLFQAASGAKETEFAVQSSANNIANASTPGYKADVHQFRTILASGHGHDAKAYALSEHPGVLSSRGPMEYTGESTDLTVKGDGWMVFELNGERYLRQSASLTTDIEGFVKDSKGGNLISDNGPLQLPEYKNLHFGKDGRISIQPIDANENAVEQLGRVLLTKPPHQELTKGKLGEVILANNAPIQEFENITLLQGVREGSNVNSVAEMASLMALQAQFTQQQAVMKASAKQSEQSNSLLRIN